MMGVPGQLIHGSLLLFTLSYARPSFFDVLLFKFHTPISSYCGAPGSVYV